MEVSKMQCEGKISNFFPKTSDKYETFSSKIIIREVKTEILEPIEGEISGKVPEWLSGCLIMNGPGTLTVGETKLNHLFDGMAILQKFTISAGGKITYQNKFIKSESYTKGKENNHLMFSEFGTAGPQPSLFQKLRTILTSSQTDNTIVSVYPISNNFYALTEIPYVNRIDPKTIDLIERVDLTKKFEMVIYTSHPHVTLDGTAYNVGLSFTPAAVYNIICFPKGENFVKDAFIAAKIPATFKFHPSYMHSFGITENYFVIIESPLIISVPNVFKNMLKSPSFDEYIKWLDGIETKILLVHRATGTLCHTFYTNSFFGSHTINQFEKDDEVIVDVISYEDGEVMGALKIEELKKDDDPVHNKKFNAFAIRFILPLKAEERNVNLVKYQGSSASANLLDDGKVFCTPELLTEIACEFPCVNFPNYLGVDYKYFYTVAGNGALMKTDITTKMNLLWKGENHFAWEPAFVPSPNAVEEDDGVVVAGFLSSENSNFVGIVILDAKNMKELARAEFKNLSTEITRPIHGWYLDDQES